jgi:hypothetical protein
MSISIVQTCSTGLQNDEVSKRVCGLQNFINLEASVHAHVTSSCRRCMKEFFLNTAAGLYNTDTIVSAYDQAMVI